MEGSASNTGHVGERHVEVSILPAVNQGAEELDNVVVDGRDGMHVHDHVVQALDVLQTIDLVDGGSQPAARRFTLADAESSGEVNHDFARAAVDDLNLAHATSPQHLGTPIVPRATPRWGALYPYDP